MSKIRKVKGGGVIFYCPGCDDTHQINTTSTGPQWSYNNDEQNPTFSPSVLYTSGHYVQGESRELCWCTFEARLPQFKGKKHPVCIRCHSFVKNGKIQFLGDSTHRLAGQTVEIPDWPFEAGKYNGLDEPDQVK